MSSTRWRTRARSAFNPCADRFVDHQSHLHTAFRFASKQIVRELRRARTVIMSVVMIVIVVVIVVMVMVMVMVMVVVVRDFAVRV